MNRLIGGGLLIFFGLFMLLGVLAGTKDYPFIVDIFRFALFIVLPMTAGGMLIKRHYGDKEKAKSESEKIHKIAREKEVLKYIRASGKVTIADLVSETSVNADEAEEILNDLIVKRLVDMTMDETGGTVYEWIELETVERRRLRDNDFLKD